MRDLGRQGGWRAWAGRAALAVLLCGLSALAQAPSASEHEVKAAFLFNFAKFVEWPPGSLPPDRFVICSVHADEVGEALEAQLQDRKLDERRIEVRRRPAALDGCNIVYIGEEAGPRTRELLRALRSPVLTAGETGSFLQEGGMVAFAIEGGRVRFDVASDTAESHGLKISSRLLRLARTVRRRRGET